MIKPLPFDELNTFRDVVAEDIVATGSISVSPKKMADTVLDFLIMAYIFGYSAVNDTFHKELKPLPAKQTEAIYKEIAGETWEQRVLKYSAEGNIEDIKRVAETDMVRVYNQAVLDAANEVQEEDGVRLKKTWMTMLDERVRDTHAYLEGMTVPLDAEFYTYDGDHAFAPGGFISAENNVGCRCQIDVSL